MKTIEKKATKLFFKNMEFFRTFDPELYDKLSHFNDALSNNIIEETLFLEFKNNEFNIYDKKTKSYVYNNGSNNYSKYVNDQLNLKHTSGFNTLHEYAYSLTHDTNVNTDVEHIKQSLVEYTSYINKYLLPKDKKHFLFIPKFIAIGTLLGYHLEQIQKKVSPQVLLIIEPNIEMFRLSLFTIDYSKLSKKTYKLFFSIAEIDNKSLSKLEKFYSFNFTHNYFIKFFITNNSSNYENYLEQFYSIWD